MDRWPDFVTEGKVPVARAEARTGLTGWESVVFELSEASDDLEGVVHLKKAGTFRRNACPGPGQSAPPAVPAQEEPESSTAAFAP